MRKSLLGRGDPLGSVRLESLEKVWISSDGTSDLDFTK